MHTKLIKKQYTMESLQLQSAGQNSLLCK